MRLVLMSLHWVEYLIEMGNALAKRGHDVHVIFERTRIAATVGNSLTSLLRPEVTAHLVRQFGFGLRDPRQVVTVVKLLRILRSVQPDVLSLHEGSELTLLLTLRLYTKAPLLLTVHDVTRHPGFDSDELPRKGWVRRWLRKRAAAVIVHGEWLREEYIRLTGTSRGSVFSVPHGCYMTFKTMQSTRVQEIENSLLFFGRIHSYKGLEYLISAAEKLAPEIPDLKVIIAGDGSVLDRYSDVLANRDRYILHRGYLPNAKVAEVFQQASVVVLPYVEGSQSGVARIAYAFGKPVVVTDVGSIAESVMNGVTGLIVPPRDEGALAAAIRTLLENPAKRRSMGQAGARLAAGALSWDLVAARTERIMSRLGRRA